MFHSVHRKKGNEIKIVDREKIVNKVFKKRGCKMSPLLFACKKLMLIIGRINHNEEEIIIAEIYKGLIWTQTMSEKNVEV